MIDKDVIKALEGCNKPLSENSCTECAFHHSGRCTHNMLNAVLDLIKRQKAEIERLQSMNQAKLDTIHDLQSEIEQLDEDRNNYQNLYCLTVKDLETAKYEAVREFAERLKKKYRSWEDNHGNWIQYIELDYIDNLVKEMVGDSNAD